MALDIRYDVTLCCNSDTDRNKRRTFWGKSLASWLYKRQTPQAKSWLQHFVETQQFCYNNSRFFSGLLFWCWSFSSFTLSSGFALKKKIWKTKHSPIIDSDSPTTWQSCKCQARGMFVYYVFQVSQNPLLPPAAETVWCWQEKYCYLRHHTCSFLPCL